MTAVIKINLSKHLYLKDPEETELGRNIISESILLIDEIGFEKFTFKKLAERISSTEASVYRYFESKHKLLVYLVSWYWSWIEYMIDFKTTNIDDAAERLSIAIHVLSESSTDDPRTTHVDEEALHRVVVGESSKAFMLRDVKKHSKEGVFRGYQSLVELIAGIITEIDPDFENPKALGSTCISMVHRQLFYSRHIPGITELRVKSKDQSQVANFVEDLMQRVLDI